ETMRKVMDEPPLAPRLQHKLTDRDLETICLKCMEKEPERRYGSAVELAEDIERWQRSEPIRARPATPVEHVAKWGNRNKMAFAAIVSFVLLVAAGLTISIAEAIRATRAEREQTHLRQQAQLQAEESRRSLVRLRVAEGNRLLEEGDPLSALLWFVE